ncbi:DUF4238 domain-containing protein [Methylobacterium bullatum]|uniref:DUF4238 domain-containing protein n=1 Tax=Methylobacterium bullatum TaxID=570505 RepID=A0A679JFA6_9HYPH|nr:hypothetical protein MBLL_00686 [Methylobacterium bullatum]
MKSVLTHQKLSMHDEGQRHHYIPVCYLKQWINNKNQICQYSKPHQNRVVPNRLHPSATGYVRGLYDLIDTEDQEVREALEREFMRPIDTRAADLLREMTGNMQTMNNIEKRSAWTTFILSLMMRNPEDIRLHKAKYIADWYKSDPKRRKFYKKIWRPGLPNRVEDIIAMFDPKEIERRAMEALVPLITNPRIGEFINRMRWGTLILPPFAPVLLTSDRPLIVSNGIINEDSHILIPIGPKHIFYAVNNGGVVDYLKARNPAEMAFIINRSVTQQAVTYVYAQWDIHRKFVQEYMGTAQLPSLIERMQDTPAAQKGYKRLQRLRRKGLLP